MRLRILSDLHLEFAKFEPPPAEADVIVLAGDIYPGVRSIRWIREKFPRQPVVLVLGNHEFYGHALPRLNEKLKAICAEGNILLLDDSGVSIDGVRFLGSTLWTDFNLFGSPTDAGREAAAMMNDYKRIRVSPRYSKLKGRDTAKMHARSRQWLEESCREPFGGPTVIVTHHAPSARSLTPGFESHILSAAYASPLDGFVARCGAALWVHGHTHWSVDYQIGSTRVLANQRGSPDAAPNGFDPSLVVTV